MADNSMLVDNPRRYQRKWAVGADIPANAVYVGRPTPWGNPFKINVFVGDTAEVVVDRFRRFVADDLDLAALRGKDLVCWCPLNAPCHADVLLELANA